MNERLAPHFRLGEFVRSETATRCGFDNTPPDAAVAELRRVALRLELVRALLPADCQRVSITSGYRCAALNTRLGGRKTSQHRRGRAADFVVTGMTPEAVFRLVLQAGDPVGRLILEPTWLHFDLGAGAADAPVLYPMLALTDGAGKITGYRAIAAQEWLDENPG